MAKTSATVEVRVAQGEAFELLTTPERLGEWLVFHQSWQGDPPLRSALGKDARIDTVIDVKGTSLPLTWKIDAYDDPRDFRFSSKAKGVKIMIALAVAPAGAGSQVTFTLELGGLPVVGPIGKKAVDFLHDDVERSLEQFRTLVG